MNVRNALHSVAASRGLVMALVIGTGLLSSCQQQKAANPIAPTQMQGYDAMMKSGGMRPAGAMPNNMMPGGRPGMAPAGMPGGQPGTAPAGMPGAPR